MSTSTDKVSSQVEWLLNSSEPWTRYRTLLDLLDYPETDMEVVAARSEMLDNPQVKELLAKAANWPGYGLKRHNDANHPIYVLSTLADFGIRHDDPGMGIIVDGVLSHQSTEGAFQTLLNISPKFGGSGEDTWHWILCDAPTLVYSLLAMGLVKDARVHKAVEHLTGLVDDNGWRCVSEPELGARFRGPGRRSDPCPIANVVALKALSQVPELLDCPATRHGVEMLLWHWEQRGERKFYLFGIGTDYLKLKYPYVWYDILHVTDILSRFKFAHQDPRYRQMVASIMVQADGDGHYTAGSMYRAWQGWSFADKKHPSPWLTFLAMRIQKRGLIL